MQIPEPVRLREDIVTMFFMPMNAAEETLTVIEAVPLLLALFASPA
jgi:hypothetical protein